MSYDRLVKLDGWSSVNGGKPGRELGGWTKENLSGIHLALTV
ncbi:MAG: hypothetical protein ACTSXC_08135 [Candidatus Freyarchaeota archaeon]